MQELETCGDDDDLCQGFVMCDDDLEFSSYEDIFATPQPQDQSFEDLVSACSSMGQSTSFSESSAPMESIPEEKLLDSQVVSTLVHVCDCILTHFRCLKWIYLRWNGQVSTLRYIFGTCNDFS